MCGDQPITVVPALENGAGRLTSMKSPSRGSGGTRAGASVIGTSIRQDTHATRRPTTIRFRYMGGHASDEALLGSLPYLIDLDTRHGSRVAVPQFVRRERGDNSLLIGS